MARDEEMVDAEEEEVELDISNADVVTKYRTAGDIANRTLAKIVAAAAPGTPILALCDLGDNAIVEETKAIYGKVKEKGIAFPTCISVNNCGGHYSPLASEANQTLNVGDVVKVDLAVHIDGFIATAAHTFVCGQNPATPIEGKVADLIAAANTAAEAVLRLMKPGNKNTQVSEVIQKVAAAYGVNAVEGVLSHQIKRFVIDGNKVIMNKPTVEQKVDEVTFEPNEVYSIDIVFSTGEGKLKELGEQRTTVFKRAVDRQYNLKMQTSRKFLSEVNSKFPSLPFTLRALGDEKTGRLGVVECLKHELLHAYPVLYEKQGEQLAHVKYTVLLMPTGPTRITGAAPPAVKSEKTVEDAEVKALLATSLKKKSGKKKAGAAGGSEMDTAA
eukprot:tig00000553_g2106.t1